MDLVRCRRQSGSAAGHCVAVFRANDSSCPIFAQSGAQCVELRLELWRLENRHQIRVADDDRNVADSVVRFPRIEYSKFLRKLFSSARTNQFSAFVAVARRVDVLLGMVFSRLSVVRHCAGISRTYRAVRRNSAASRALWLGAHRQTTSGNVGVVRGRLDSGKCRVAAEIVAFGVFGARFNSRYLGDIRPTFLRRLVEVRRAA